jgi:uroporphyrinogen-III synthase
VYRRVPVTPSPRALAAVRGLAAPAVLAVTSGEALQLSVDSLPADVLVRLRALPVAAASERLVELARALGFPHCHRAPSARPADLIEAAVTALA